MRSDEEDRDSVRGQGQSKRTGTVRGQGQRHNENYRREIRLCPLTSGPGRTGCEGGVLEVGYKEGCDRDRWPWVHQDLLGVYPGGRPSREIRHSCPIAINHACVIHWEGAGTVGGEKQGGGQRHG